MKWEELYSNLKDEVFNRKPAEEQSDFINRLKFMNTNEIKEAVLNHFDSIKKRG